MEDCLREYFGKSISRKTVLDAACGLGHPGLFLLARMGFKQVAGMDLYASHPLMQKLNLGNLKYLQGDLTQPIPRHYDAICCISLLEHLSLEDQQAVLTNLSQSVFPQGAIVLTFVVPGI